jgi:co-chaperonin GroES (HSP10)
MVELRKRKTPPPAPVRPAKKKATAKSEKPAKGKGLKAAVAEKIEAVKEAVTGKSNGEKAATPSALKVGDSVDLAAFGGEVETNEGTKTTLAKLLEESKGGVVLFTYPKASTPGCKCSPEIPRAHTAESMLTRLHHRYQASMPLPRLLRATHCNRVRHLRSLER